MNVFRIRAHDCYFLVIFKKLCIYVFGPKKMYNYQKKFATFFGLLILIYFFNYRYGFSKTLSKKILEEITMKLGILPLIYSLDLRDDHLFRAYVYIIFEHGQEPKDEPFEYFKIGG